MSDAAQLGFEIPDAEVFGQAARPLPEPGKLRFQPLRAGILNVWQYEDQELRFHDGRLILRGENGSGKSKALEVLLPFLLDADLSPYRLDPFQGQGRSMRWNLLEGGRHESRVGYVWLELGRRAPDGGEPELVTLGCGLRATRRSQGVDAWYFLTEQRIRSSRRGTNAINGLTLLTPGRQPLSKKQLRHALGEAGTVFQSAGDYRGEVDKRLFELGADRFAALRHLLLQLRRPQLSEKLDPGKLSDLLGESLPPIEDDLIGELAELFERLAQHEKELVRLRAAIAAVESFLDVYREVCRGIAGRRSRDVRRGDSRFHAKSEALRATDERAREVGEQLASVGRRRHEQRQDLELLRGKIRALERSDAMRDAQALAAKEDHTRTLEAQAERDRRDATSLTDERAERERELAAAQGEAAKRQNRLADPVRRAAEGAARVGLEAIHDGARRKLAEDAVAHDDEARATVRAAVRERRRAAGELRELAQERDRSEARFRRREERRREADEQVRAAHERERDAVAAADGESERLDAALTEWAEACAELALDDEELERLRRIVQPDASLGENRLEAAVAELGAVRHDRLVEARAALANRLAARREERQATADERRRVDEARELGPEPSRTRSDPREDRPGAPFYLLCDFAGGVGESERAGLEAALEAAGLLDAWVMPDGRLLDPEALDAVLVAGAPAAGAPAAGAPAAEAPAAGARTLADVLVATESADVDAEVVNALLAQIALDVSADGAAAVDARGRFRLGPLAGRWMKPEAEHLGAAAREAARRRRLAELDARLAELDARLAELEAEDRGLLSRLDRLAEEVREAPRTAELERLRHAASAAGDDLGRRRAELIEAETGVAAARRERDEARRRLTDRAAELGLTAWTSDLAGYRERLRDYQLLFEETARVYLAARRADLAAERARDRAAEARERHDEASRRAARGASEARSARAEVDALRQTAGAEARQIVERHAEAVGRRDRLEASLDRLQDELIDLRERRAVVDERRRHQAAELDQLDGERRRASERLERLVELGFLDLVLDEPGERETESGSWSLRRALAVARAIAKETSDVDLSQAAADRRINRLMPRYRELDGEIGGDFQPRLDQEDEIVIFRVSHQQRDHDGPQLAAVLRAEVAERDGELAEDERELMRRILLGDVGDHLRGRLRQAQELIGQMNALLVACPTASGMTLRLSWRADEDTDPRVREVLSLLLRDPELLGDAERRKLEDFFQARIEEARQEHILVPWREHLIQALDYRRWHRFGIERRMPGQSAWSKLTQKAHAASSGGEKAVALHLPLFAAAAAHYRSARDEAPRLILLDEAFAGIDPGMRGRCMALLVDFDLDFMMTSYDEWGCYQELPGVATYQLLRDPTVGGVEAIRFVWNGERLVEEDGIEHP